MNDSAPRAPKNRLAELPFFQGFDRAFLDAISENAVERTYDTGKEIVREGDPAHEFFVLLQGKVGLEIEQADRPRRTIRTLGAGEVVGWSWLDPVLLPLRRPGPQADPGDRAGRAGDPLRAQRAAGGRLPVPHAPAPGDRLAAREHPVAAPRSLWPLSSLPRRPRSPPGRCPRALRPDPLRGALAARGQLRHHHAGAHPYNRRADPPLRPRPVQHAVRLRRRRGGDLHLGRSHPPRGARPHHPHGRQDDPGAHPDAPGLGRRGAGPLRRRLAGEDRRRPRRPRRGRGPRAAAAAPGALRDHGAPRRLRPRGDHLRRAHPQGPAVLLGAAALADARGHARAGHRRCRRAGLVRRRRRGHDAAPRLPLRPGQDDRLRLRPRDHDAAHRPGGRGPRGLPREHLHLHGAQHEVRHRTVRPLPARSHLHVPGRAGVSLADPASGT